MARQISLTVQEQKVFATLVNVVQENELSTTLRVAGGWVRDKVSDMTREAAIEAMPTLL